MDIASISTALGSIKTASEIAKLIKNSDLSLQDAELKMKLADLISSLADAKIEIAEVQSELMEKQGKISELEGMLKLKGEVTWDKPYYWLGPVSEKNGPYCQKCFDDSNKLIRLQGNGEGYWDCKVCKSGYEDSTYSPKAFVQFSKNRWDDY